VACGFRRITSNAWEVHGLWSTTAIMSQQQSKGRLASCLPPGARYSSVRHDLRTSGRRASLLVRLSYLHLRCAQNYIRWQPAGGSASAQFTRVYHIDGKPIYSQLRRPVASVRLIGSCEQAIECEDRAQLLTAEHEAKARKCQDLGPQTRSRLMGSRFR
jgi:hypothetical protein